MEKKVFMRLVNEVYLLQEKLKDSVDDLDSEDGFEMWDIITEKAERYLEAIEARREAEDNYAYEASQGHNPQHFDSAMDNAIDVWEETAEDINDFYSWIGLEEEVSDDFLAYWMDECENGNEDVD